MKKPTASATAAGTTPPSEKPPTTQLVQPEPQQSELQPANSQELIISNLRRLSDALLAFGQCLSDVEQHIDSARTSIDSAVQLLVTPPPVTLPIPEPEPEPEPEPKPEPEPEASCESDPSEDEDEDEEAEDEDEEEEDDDDDEEEEEEEEVKSAAQSELEMLCKTMNSVALKKYMITHLSDIDELRKQVPKALKHSPNPARLVLEFINKGGERCVNSSGGLATLLALECFLLMMEEAKDEGRVVEIEKKAKEEAEKAALVWRGRMISQGGISKAHEMDARGLLLLIGCFGIPRGFLDRDIRYLVDVSGARGISGALRRSSALMEKIPDIIQWMLKKNIVTGAVDIAYTFGMEDRFNPRKILTSFLHHSEVAHLNSTTGLEQGIAVCAGKKKYLSDLKLVGECLERHKIDPSKLLPGWQIDVRIMNLENEIAELNMHIGETEVSELTRHKGDQKMAQKRKIDETESSASFNNKEMKPSHFPNPNPNPWPLQQHRVVNHVDGSNNALLERGGTAGHIYGYSLPHGTVAGSIHENGAGSLVEPVGGVVAMDGAGAGKSVKGGSYAGVHGGTLVDHTHGQIGSHAGQLYGPRGDAAVHDRLDSHIYAYRPSSYLEGSGSTGLPNTVPGDAYRPSPYLEGSVGWPDTIAGDTYRPPPYSEGSTGLPNTIPAAYQFADTVLSAALAHPSSSLYWKR